ATDRVGERIDGCPVTRLARRAAEELPRPLGVVDNEAVEETEREPARLELAFAEEPVGDEQPARRALAPGGVAEATDHRLDQRPTDPVGRAEVRDDGALARLVDRVGEAAEPLGQGPCEPVR